MADWSLDDLPKGAVLDDKPAAAWSLDDLPKGAVLDEKPEADKPSILGGVGRNILRAARGVMDLQSDQFGKDVVTGVKEAGTGLAEKIPYKPISEPAATKSRELHASVKYPAAEVVGESLPFVLGGEWLGAGKAASLVPKIAEEAPGFLSGVGRVLTGTGRGAVRGGVMGAEAGAAAPTGESDPAKLWPKVRANALKGGAAGALIGAPLESVSPIAREAWRGGRNLLDVARGKEVNEGISQLRGQASKEAGAFAQHQTAESRAAAEQGQRLETKLGEETKGLETTKTQLGEAEAGADRLTKEFQAKPTMSPVEFGGRVRALANDTYESLVKKRAEESGYTTAIAEADPAPIVKTDKIQSYLDSWKEKTADPNAQAVIRYVESQIKDDEGNTVAGTIRKMDSMRKVLNRLYRTQDMKAIGGDGSAATSTFEIGEINKLVRGAIEEADPRVAQAAAKFRELSRPLDPFERKGALAGAVKTDELSDEYVVEEGKLLASLLSRTKSGADPFVLLIQRDPQLKDAARKYFQSDFLGEAGLNKTRTPEQMTAWLVKNKRALEQTGLLPEFTAMRDQAAGAAESVSRLKLETEVRNGNVKAVQSALDEAQKAGKLSGESAKKYNTLLTELDAAAVPDKSLSQTLIGADKSAIRVAGKTREIFKQLLEDNRISQEDYGNVLRKIDDLEAKKINRNRIVATLKQVALTGTLLAGGWPAYHAARVLTGL